MKMLQMTKCFLFTSLISIAVSLNDNCAPGEERKEGKCKSCEVGYYSRDGLKCKPCSTCHHIQTLLRKCSSTEDAFCTCPEGTYLQDGVFCSLCQKCSSGKFQVVDCTHNLDRVCQNCPRGQISNGTNSKTCFFKSSAPDIPEAKTEVTKKWPYVVVGVASLLFFSCILVILLKYFKKRKRFLVCGNLLLLNENEDLNAVQSYSTNYESSSSNNQTRRQLKDVPADLFFELGKKLNPAFANNWKVLAGQLGYTYEQIAHFDLSPQTATVDLLYDWSTGEDATLSYLYNKLILIKRLDAAEIVLPYLQ